MKVSLCVYVDELDQLDRGPVGLVSYVLQIGCFKKNRFYYNF